MRIQEVGFLAVTFMLLIFWLLVGSFRVMDTARQVATMKDQQFHGYLYTLNPQGTWDCLRTNQIDLCKKQQCAALVFSVGEGGK